MSIKSFLGLTVGGMLCLSCQSNVYQIHGFAHDFMDGDTICLRFESDEDRLVTITQVADGKFTFSGETDAVSLCHIYPKSKPENTVSLFLEPSQITVELSLLPLATTERLYMDTRAGGGQDLIAASDRQHNAIATCKGRR